MHPRNYYSFSIVQKHVLMWTCAGFVGAMCRRLNLSRPHRTAIYKLTIKFSIFSELPIDKFESCAIIQKLSDSEPNMGV